MHKALLALRATPALRVQLALPVPKAIREIRARKVQSVPWAPQALKEPPVQ